MIYCHDPMPCPPTATGAAARVFKPGRPFTHLCADTDQELIEYAVSIGMKAAWIQYPGTPRAHFDVTGNFLKVVLNDDRCVKLPRDEWARKRFPKYFEDKRDDQNGADATANVEVATANRASQDAGDVEGII